MNRTRNRLTVLIAVLAASTSVISTASASVPAEQSVTLPLNSRPKVQRPLLEMLGREAAANRVTLLEAVRAYAAKRAAEDPQTRTNRPDGDVVDGAVIDPTS